MAKHYVTFGQEHVHSIGGRTFDRNVVARFEAANPSEGREYAFQLFGPKFCFEYHNIEPNMKYFPGGFVDID